MKAKRPKNPIEKIETAEHLLKVLSDLNSIESDMTTLVKKEADEITKVRKRFSEGEIGKEKISLEEKRNQLLSALETYAKNNRKNWNGQTLSEDLGTFGYRWSPHSVVQVKSVAKKVEDVLLNLKVKFKKYIRAKYSVNKERIIEDHIGGNLEKEELYNCGLKIKQTEKFFVKTQFSESLEKAQENLNKA